MKALVWSWLVVGVSLGTAVSGVRRGADSSGCTGDRRAAGRSVRLGCRLRDHRGCAGGGDARVRRAVFGGADVRPLRGVRGGSGRRQHGGGLGGVVRFGGHGAAGGAVGVRLARWLGLHGPGVGLQRPGGRGGAGSEPARPAADSAGPAVGRLRPWGSGRCVRSADAGGDSELCSRREAYVRPGTWMDRRSRRCAAGAAPSLQHL